MIGEICDSGNFETFSLLMTVDPRHCHVNIVDVSNKTEY